MKFGEEYLQKKLVPEFNYYKMQNVIVHISEVDISTNSGMGRVEYYWEIAIKNAGYKFVHIGPKEIGQLKHKSLFPYKAYSYFKTINKNVAAIIVHEPAAMFFINKRIPVFIESHGIERRRWEQQLKEDKKIGFKTKFLYPLWRLLSCDIGLKKATKLLLINTDDKEYVINKYKRKANDIYVFKNGVYPIDKIGVPEVFTVLFNGSWIERKGIFTLIEAAKQLHAESIEIKYLIIGTGFDKMFVLNNWPEYLKPNLTIVPTFNSNNEADYLGKASVIVLPSNFEGQPLSILQAMAAGKCCITTNCCGQKDFIKDGINGLLFKKHDSIEFARLIKTCYYNPDKIKEIGLNAIDSMKNRNWKSVSNELVEYLKKSINHY